MPDRDKDALVHMLFTQQQLREAYEQGLHTEEYITQLKHTIQSQRRLLREVSLAAHSGAWHDVREKVRQHLNSTLEN